MTWPEWTFWLLFPFAVIGCWRVCHWIFTAIDQYQDRKDH